MNFDGWPDVLRNILSTLPTHLPVIFGALVLVVVGWIAAKLLAVLGRTLSERALHRLTPGEAVASALDASGIRSVVPRLVGSFVFWMVLLLFVVASIEVLGLPILTDLIGRLTAYLPNIIAAVALVVVGFAAGRLARGAVARGAVLMQLETQSAALAGVAQALILTIAGVMALEQLGIQGRVMEMVLAVTLGTTLAAGGLAFALGARSAVANIVAARYVAQVCAVGQEIELDGIRGSIVELTSTAVIVKAAEGRVVIPAGRFHEGCPVLLEAS